MSGLERMAKKAWRMEEFKKGVHTSNSRMKSVMTTRRMS